MKIDPDASTPIYRQIERELRAAIAAGVYRPGEMIPSIRTLALDLLVNPNTVQRAYVALESAGLVHSVRGRGMFVSGRGAGTARAGSRTEVRKAFEGGLEIARNAGFGDGDVDRIWNEAKRADAKRSEARR